MLPPPLLPRAQEAVWRIPCRAGRLCTSDLPDGQDPERRRHGYRWHPNPHQLRTVGPWGEIAVGRESTARAARAELVAQHLHGQASALGMLTELLTSMAGRWSAVELRRLQLTPRARGWSTTDPPGPVLADKVNDSRANREYVRQRGISAAIPIKVDQAANRRKKGSKGDRPRTFDTHLPAAPRWSAAATGSNAPWCGHAVRQTRRALPGHTPHRRNQRMAMTRPLEHGLGIER
jgi:hypothetical protein